MHSLCPEVDGDTTDAVPFRHAAPNRQRVDAAQVVMCPEKSHPQENKEKALLGYTQAVDAWALGVLAYELIVGHPPFERETRTDTYEQIMYRRPHYPTALSEAPRSFISAALTKVCLTNSSGAKRHLQTLEHAAVIYVVLLRPSDVDVACSILLSHHRHSEGNVLHLPLTSTANNSFGVFCSQPGRGPLLWS